MGKRKCLGILVIKGAIQIDVRTGKAGRGRSRSNTKQNIRAIMIQKKNKSNITYTANFNSHGVVQSEGVEEEYADVADDDVLDACVSA